MAKRPNILFFGIDSLRRDHMSLYGYHRLTTPNISKYAEGGVVFDHCFSPHIPTTPGYSNMMTGSCLLYTSSLQGRFFPGNLCRSLPLQS